MNKTLARRILAPVLALALVSLAAACSKAEEAKDKAAAAAADMKDKAAAAAADVKDKAAAAAADVKDKATAAAADMKDKAAAAAADVKDKAAAVAKDAKDSSQQLLEKAKETGHSVVAATEQQAESISNDVAAKRDAVVREAQHRLGAIDAGITTLQGKVDKAQGSAKQELADQLTALRARRAAVHEKMIALGKASGAAWDDLANGLKQAEHELSLAIDEALARFSK